MLIMGWDEVPGPANSGTRSRKPENRVISVSGFAKLSVSGFAKTRISVSGFAKPEIRVSLARVSVNPRYVLRRCHLNGATRAVERLS